MSGNPSTVGTSVNVSVPNNVLDNVNEGETMTLCLNCGKKLSGPGEGRLAASNYDQRLPQIPNHSGSECDVTWRRCDACYSVALDIRMVAK